MDRAPTMSYEKDSDVQMDITFERNLDMVSIARDGYTVLDWISDIGGIQGILISAVAIILSFWNYNYLDNYLVSRLFRLGKRDTSKQVDHHQTEAMTASSWSGAYDMLPSCM